MHIREEYTAVNYQNFAVKIKSRGEGSQVQINKTGASILNEGACAASDWGIQIMGRAILGTCTRFVCTEILLQYKYST